MHHLLRCIIKVDGTKIGDAEDLDFVMPMYNFTEYSSNYSDTTGSLWFYFKDEATNFNVYIANNNAFKSFECKTKLLENTVGDRNNTTLKYATIALPLK